MARSDFDQAQREAAERRQHENRTHKQRMVGRMAAGLGEAIDRATNPHELGIVPDPAAASALSRPAGALEADARGMFGKSMQTSMARAAERQAELDQQAAAAAGDSDYLLPFFRPDEAENSYDPELEYELDNAPAVDVPLTDPYGDDEDDPLSW